MFWTSNTYFDYIKINSETLIFFHGLAFLPKLSSMSANVQITWACKEC